MVVIDEHDIGKSKLDLLTDLIYESYGRRIPLDKVKYGHPQELDVRPDILDDPNTFIPATIDINYCGNRSPDAGFMYRRRTLKEYFDDNPVNVAITTFPISIRQLLVDQINPQLPFPIDPLDIKDDQVTDPTLGTIRIRPVSDSFIWCTNFDLTVTPLDPDYFKLVTIQSLNGFNEYVPPP